MVVTYKKLKAEGKAEMLCPPNFCPEKQRKHREQKTVAFVSVRVSLEKPLSTFL